MAEKKQVKKTTKNEEIVVENVAENHNEVAENVEQVTENVTENVEQVVENFGENVEQVAENVTEITENQPSDPDEFAKQYAIPGEEANDVESVDELKKKLNDFLEENSKKNGTNSKRK